MVDLPCISVVTPVSNGARTLERNLESVWQSRHWVCEHIIQDNVSTDGSREIVERWREKTNGFVKPVFLTDSGVADGFNKGVQRATGQWVAIQNADDWYDDDAFRHVENYLNEPMTIIHGRLRQHREDGVIRELGTRSYNEKRDFNPRAKMATQHPTCIISRDVYEKVGLYNTRYLIAMDFDFLLRAHLAGVKFRYVHEVISNFSRGGISSANPILGWQEMLDSKLTHLDDTFGPRFWCTSKVVRYKLRKMINRKS